MTLAPSIDLEIVRQPDDITCGPTCLHAIYRYYESSIPLEQVVREVKMLENRGGTIAAALGYHALTQGYRASIYSFNLNMFDPTWFNLDAKLLIRKLKEQLGYKRSTKFKFATEAYIDFMNAGGLMRFQDLTVDLLVTYLIDQRAPILVGLSATYLYRCSREVPATTEYDDIKGEPSGHFVLLRSIDTAKGEVTISDPYHPNPLSENHTYKVKVEHLICAILLGVVTYDANLLVIKKPKGGA